MVTRTTLTLLQQAGEALYAAQQAMAQEVQTGSVSVVNTVASSPFSAEADRAYAELRNVARLAHELQAMEEQLRGLYQTAATFSRQDVQVLKALSLPRAARAPSTPAKDPAEDVVARPVSAKARRKVPKGKAPAGNATTRPAALSANDAKVLAFIERTLNRDRWTAMSQAAMAQAAGIPKGSIAVAIKRLQQLGHLVEGERGQYRLG